MIRIQTIGSLIRIFILEQIIQLNFGSILGSVWSSRLKSCVTRRFLECCAMAKVSIRHVVVDHIEGCIAVFAAVSDSGSFDEVLC